MEHAMEDFPGSPFQEEMQYLIIDCNYQYAKQSTDRRKLERFNDAIQAFHTFATRFPESSRMKDAQRLYDASVKAISELELGTPTNPANR
jgi:outer membrane protein assembly factor BamD